MHGHARNWTEKVDVGAYNKIKMAKPVEEVHPTLFKVSILNFINNPNNF